MVMCCYKWLILLPSWVHSFVSTDIDVDAPRDTHILLVMSIFNVHLFQ